jgi:hypothetical protein
MLMTFRKTAMTRKDFQNRVESFLIGAMGEYCKAQVANANAYSSYFQRWQNEVDRLLFVELSFFIGCTKTSFDKRKLITKVIARYDSADDFRASLLTAKKLVATRYLKQPYADLMLPEVEPSRNAFWLMVSEAVELALEEL